MDSQILRNSIIFWSRLGMGYDPPVIGDDGLPVLYDESFREFEFHRSMYKNGIRVHSFILNSGWIGDGKYDYTVPFRIMDKAVNIGEDVLLIPRIKLNVPIDWCYNHPEEVFVYHNGPQTVPEIKKLVGTSEHDYLGYEAPDGVYMGSDKYKRPNVNGKISLQSFSSEIWLNDAKKALRNLIIRLEKRYKEKIAGYHIAYGTSGETIMWGRISERYGDYGISNLKHFSRYVKDKYGKEAFVPSPDERYSQTNNMSDFLRVDNKISVYYDEFTSEVNSNVINELCKTVKETAPNALAGVFYGYFTGLKNIAYTGHCAIDKVLNSPYVDFLAAPKLYHKSAPGESGGEFCTTQSVNLKKLWIDECDIRTHLTKDVPPEWKSENILQTENALMRELAKNLSHNSGFWLMDLGGGWYDSDEMQELTQKLCMINSKIRQKPYKSESDILVLADESSIMSTAISNDLIMGFVSDFICNLKKSGALADIYRVSDIKDLELSKYNLIIFAHTLKLTKENIQYIKSHTNAAFMFNYAAGVIQDGSKSLSSVKQITGFSVKESDKGIYDFPQIEISEYDSVLCDDGKGGCIYRKLSEGRIHYLNNFPYTDADSLKPIIAECGCHIYCEGDCVLHGDNRFLTVTSGKNGYSGLIDFGKERQWKSLSEDKAEKGNKTYVSLKPYETAMFIYE